MKPTDFNSEHRKFRIEPFPLIKYQLFPFPRPSVRNSSTRRNPSKFHKTTSQFPWHLPIECTSRRDADLQEVLSSPHLDNPYFSDPLSDASSFSKNRVFLCFRRLVSGPSRHIFHDSFLANSPPNFWPIFDIHMSPPDQLFSPSLCISLLGSSLLHILLSFQKNEPEQLIFVSELQSWVVDIADRKWHVSWISSRRSSHSFSRTLDYVLL